MRILIVSATALEIAPLVTRLEPSPLVVRQPVLSELVLRQAQDERVEGAHRERESLTLSSSKGERVAAYSHRGHDIDVLVTGVGMVATAAWTARTLADSSYGLALNLGVCGSFDAAFAPGSVVHVVSDRMTELGAEDGESFLTIRELGLLEDDAVPFSQGRLVNARPPANAALHTLPSVHGVTVNTVHGNDRSIADIAHRFALQIESMEGAGFMYACLIHEIPFAQVRAVSNMVERRNRAAWKMTEAIAGLERAALDILECL